MAYPVCLQAIKYIIATPHSRTYVQIQMHSDAHITNPKRKEIFSNLLLVAVSPTPAGPHSGEAVDAVRLVEHPVDRALYDLVGGVVLAMEVIPWQRHTKEHDMTIRRLCRS